MARIVLTGGGTAGHVSGNVALLPGLLERDMEVHYIGTHTGIERELVASLPGVTYHAIQSGKLRRYFDLRNLTDPFRVLIGAGQASRIIGKLKPGLVFSKGGFVSVPVIFAAWRHRIPAIVHESDMTPGLSNRLAIPMARFVCTTFPETLQHLPKGKGVYTGTPLRGEILQGTRQHGLTLAGFDGKKPVLLMTGGSLGAVSINTALRAALPQLLPRYDVLHLCGKGNLDEKAAAPGYCQLEYLKDGMADALAAANVVISRAGSNSIYELLVLRKPALLIPYPKTASRGDQILNAASFERRGFSRVLDQEQMTADRLVSEIDATYAARESLIAAMSAEPFANGIAPILELIDRHFRY